MTKLTKPYKPVSQQVLSLLLTTNLHSSGKYVYKLHPQVYTLHVLYNTTLGTCIYMHSYTLYMVH